MKIVFHAINGVGLGHLVRTWCIAREVRAVWPEDRILFVTNARAPDLLREDGFDLVHLPPRASEPHADPTRSATGLPDDLDQLAVLSVLEVFGPDLVVFDTHAPPALVEATTALGARAVLVLRELRPERMAAWLGTAAAAAFDQILVPHDSDEVPPDALPDHLPLRWVGPVVRPRPEPVEDGPDVLVVAGGGGQPVEVRRLLRAAADAHWLARARQPELRTVLVAPPGAGVLPRYPGLSVRPPGPDVPAAMAAARVVVGQAGYNTVAELRAWRKPAVLVPGARRMEDQAARADRLVAIGAAVRARPEASSLARLLVGVLRGDRCAQMAEAHARWPLVPGNRAAADAALRVLRPSEGPVSRAVIVAHDFPPRIGGMETVARCLATALAEGGLDVAVYTTYRLGLDPSVAGPARVRPLFSPLPNPGSIDLWRDLLLTLDALLRDRPDVVHLSNAGLAPWVPAIRAVWPCRVTVHVHGNDLLAPWVHSGAPAEAYRSALSAGLRAADRVIAVSDFSAGLARAAGVEEARLGRVHNGVSIPAAPERGRDAGGAPVLLTVSRLARRKGHATLVEALPHLPGVRYRFTGRDEAQVRALLDRARALGVADRVEPLGFVPEGELDALYASASVFALVPDEQDPADVEGFGVALLEASAAGLPVVASRTGGIPEAVQDGVTGLLVPPGDSRATADAIARLLADPALAERLGQAGRQRAGERFSWAAAAAALRGIWDAAEAGPGSIEALAALASTEPASALPHVLAIRDAVRSASPAGLARLARLEARELRLASEQRRERYRRERERGRTLRLRATGDGERVLPRVLDDCAAAGAVPEVESRLDRFLDPLLRAALLPRIGHVMLHHSVPSLGAERVLAAVRALAPAEATRIRSLSLHLRPEADAAAAVPEVVGLRDALRAHGATVVPPPELMRYLSLTPPPPPTAMIEPTNRCNLACPTCPTGTGKIAPLPDLTPDRFEAVVDALRPALRNLALWNYGEPTLHKDLPGLVAAAKRRGVGVVKVSSNVHFLTGDRGVRLLESGLDVLILSVDGASQETYATFRKQGRFSRVADAVASLCAEKRRRGLDRPSIELQFIAMRHNEHEVPEIRRLAAEWGVDRLRIKTFGAEDASNRELVPEQPELSRYAADQATPNRIHPFCTRPWDHTVINVDGSVTPCCYLRPDMGDSFVMGNVFEAPFREIWRGARYRDFRARMQRARHQMPVCDRCRGSTSDLLASVEEVPR